MTNDEIPKDKLAEEYADQLGKVSCGKSCVRFRKLEDLNLKVALDRIKKSARWHAKENG